MLIRGLPFSIVLIYNVAVFVTLIFLLTKFRRSQIAVFIIFLFWGGLFADMGKLVQNVYKIVVLAFALYLPYRYYFKKTMQEVRTTWTLLTVFVTFAFCVNVIIYKDSVMLIFAQMYKYVVPAAVFPIILQICKTRNNAKKINFLFGYILLYQIAINIVKLIVLREPFEGLVGSITGVTGGGVGTTLPLLGLCWFALNTNMTIRNKKAVFFIIALLFIGWMTGKRAIWLMFPTLFTVLGVFLSRNIPIKRILPVIFMLPVFFYFGLRLSPTLNPEKQVWGSFNPQYAWNYTMDYSSGKQDDSGNRNEGDGRLGANILLFDKFFNASDMDLPTRFMGKGVKYVFSADYEQYSNRDYYMGINSRGSLTGFGMFLMAFGVIGTVLFVIYIISIIKFARNTRVKYVFGGLMLFDFIFYNSTIVQTPALMVFMMFLLVYSNVVYTEDGRYRMSCN